MIYAFVALFSLGLISAVRVMLYGVERQRPIGDDTPRSFSVSPAAAGSFCIVAGVVGYVLAKMGIQAAAVWGSSLVAGLIASVATVRVVGRWWKVVPEHDVDDERYVLQGSIGRVVSDIGEHGVGQVSLMSSAASRVLPARTIDEHSMAAGTEVVIERIEDGVAFVEDWAQVEKRL